MMNVLVAMLAAAQDDSAKLAEAAKKAAGWTSFKFSITETVEGAKKPSVPTLGTYEKDKGISTKADKKESISTGSATVSLQKDGTWKASKKAKAVTPPTSILADLEKNFSKVTASTSGTDNVYEGDLTAAGATILLDKLYKQVTGQGESKITGKVTVDKDGNIVKVEVNGSFKGQIKGKDVTANVSRTLAFSDYGIAKLEIPDDAKKALP